MANINTDESKTTKSCAKCTRKDDSNMVCCDSCDAWEHYECAGVSDSISEPDRSWKCSNCLTTTEDKTTKPSSRRNGSIVSRGSKNSEFYRMKLEKLEKEHELKLQKIQEEEDYIKKKYEILKKMEEEEAGPSSRRSDVSSTKVRERLLNWLADDGTAKTPVTGKPSDSDTTLQNALPRESSTPKDKNAETIHRAIPTTLKSVANRKIPDKEPLVPLNQNGGTVLQQNPPASTSLNQQINSLTTAINTCTFSGDQIPGVQQGNLSAPDTLPYVNPVSAATERAEPTTSQLAARQVIIKELPVFSGNPEEWPLFYAAFQNSTKYCGYSHAENLSRLQRALSGQALESVRSRLYIPESVPIVIEKLNKIYGRPVLLINSLINRMRSVPPPREDDLDSIIFFGTAVQNLVDHIKISDQRDHLKNPSLLQEIINKLPVQMQMQWGTFKFPWNPVDVDLETFNQFMTNLVDIALDLTVKVGAVAQQKSQRFKPRERLNAHYQAEDDRESLTYNPRGSCNFCKGHDHYIAQCENFKRLNLDGRWKTIRTLNLCWTCLVPHKRWPCRSNRICGVDGCRQRHHGLLHNFGESGTIDRDPTAQMDTSVSTAHHNHHYEKSFSFIRYLPVTLSANDKFIEIFAFLDDGSSTTLLESDIATQLGVTGTPDILTLFWTAKIGRQEKDSHRISVQISGIGSTNRFKIDDVRTVERLDLPSQSLNYKVLCESFPYLRGLPIQSYHDARPKMIIGIEHAKLLTSLETREGGDHEPVAIKTRLGWCTFGKGNKCNDITESLNSHISFNNIRLHDVMKQFFQTEEAIPPVNLDSETDKRARQILEETTKFIDGRYETGLLWREDRPINLPNSFPTALKRLISLEKRLAGLPDLALKVQDLLDVYERKKYAHRLTQAEFNKTDPKKTWYLPLGVVTNTKKPNKIRLIWDAAARTGGTSLNDLLLKGPDLLISLMGVLLRFRQRNIAVCADLTEMFHQIRIRDEDKHFQRFLWRKSPEEPIGTYVMDVATFGASCSPCSALFIKNKNALAHASEFPEASKSIVDNTYMDDWLVSVDTVEEAVRLSEEVKRIHAAGGFQLSKFISNVPEVLERLGELNSPLDKNLDFDQAENMERVLGMIWIPSADMFTFSTMVKPCLQRIADCVDIPTKRQVLQIIMSVFDPLGLISHYIIHGKVLMQEIWRSGSDWDEQIPQNLLDSWKRWIGLLGHLHKVRVPRCIFYNTDSRINYKLQLHTFVDASEAAYSCVVYI
ncbi:uncharacterized protein LOC129759214 [Uranotaenia lowii]|uniref:uncharacterized protein LOC129759214 n=1 Tax=Uranotaenia lowii TaxID=190385 RepID=UPI002479D0F3|nr:uncharacterized protein LOC129759214 [Uranotaenia lowii]